MPRIRSGLRQSAIPVIAVDPFVIDAQTGRQEDISAQNGPPWVELVNCDVCALQLQTDGRSRLVRTLDKERSFPPRKCTSIARRGAFTLRVAEQSGDRSDVGRGFGWKRFASCELLFKSRRTCVVGRKEACRAEAIAHLFEVGSARQFVVASVKRIETETIASAEF